ncbi:MAG TPA: GNAT family N-acetyltransferase [Chroococcales cyanobacterium]
MIRRCNVGDFQNIWAVINDGARAYIGVIPKEQLHHPYMTVDELQCEIESGVDFWCYEENGALLAVMGLQQVKDVTLIRHAYVRTASQKRGLGSKLLLFLQEHTLGPLLVGTWAASNWAIRFYQKHNFRLVSPNERDRLLKTYWTVPEQQIKASVVLIQMA